MNMKKSQNCNCQNGTGDQPDTHGKTSISLARMELSAKAARKNLTNRINDMKPLASDERSHMFPSGFCVSSGAADANSLCMSISGVVDRIPYDVTVNYDLTFFSGEGCAKGEVNDILWMEIEFTSPLRRILRIPLRAIGATRDSSSGRLLSITDFEFAADLATDVKDVLKVIGCVLACVGLFCGIACGTLCLSGVGIPLCLGCLLACIGAGVPEFLLCVTACGVAVDSIT